MTNYEFLIWPLKSFPLITKLIPAYFIGIGMSAFLRTIISHFIGKKDKNQIKRTLKTIYMYIFMCSFVFSILILISSQFVGRLFYTKDEEVNLTAKCLRIFCIHVLYQVFLPSLFVTFKYSLCSLIVMSCFKLLIIEIILYIYSLSQSIHFSISMFPANKILFVRDMSTNKQHYTIPGSIHIFVFRSYQCS